MPATNSPLPAAPPPLCPVPIAPEVWVARRFNLPSATARAVAELAFASTRREARA